MDLMPLAGPETGVRGSRRSASIATPEPGNHGDAELNKRSAAAIKHRNDASGI
jgi:hypothetical protein